MIDRKVHSGFVRPPAEPNADDIKASVNEFLETNPVTPGASAEEAAQIKLNAENIEKLQTLSEGLDTVVISDSAPNTDNKCLWIQSGQYESFDLPQINDETVSEEDTWSSKKISDELNAQVSQLSEEIAADTTALKGDLVELKSYAIKAESEGIYGEVKIDFENSSVGKLKSDGTVDASSTSWITSDYISLDDVQKVYRYGSTGKYTLGTYALYSANKTLLQFHAQTTAYDFSEFNGRNDVVFYDVDISNAKYIRLSKQPEYTFYVFALYAKISASYTINGNIYSENINKLTGDVDSLTFAHLLDSEKLENQNVVLFKYGMECLHSTFINESNGTISTSSDYANYDTSPFIELLPNTAYRVLNARTIHLYDANKNWLRCVKLSSVAVNDLADFSFDCTDVKYARGVFYNNSSVYVYGIAKKNTSVDIVCFGDSIFGLQPDIFDIPSVAQSKTGYRIANCGYGGTVACTHGNANYDVFSFHSLADSIFNEDFSAQIAQGNLSNFYSRATDNLTSVDFSSVKLITIAYGTNDWNFGNNIDNAEDKYDVTTYCGGLRYGIEKLLTKYPSIQLCLMSPIWRIFDTEGDDSDNHINGNGKHLKDFIDAMKGVAEEYHIPYFNHYNIGINKFNYVTYFRDGTHPTYVDGINLLGAKVASDIESILL